MYENDVHEMFYLNCKIHGPWFRGLVPRAGQNGYMVKMYIIYENILLYSYIYLKKMHGYGVQEDPPKS